MAKTHLDRFNDGLETFLTLGARNQTIYKAYLGVLEWLEAQPNPERAKETIGAKLSLGGYTFHTAKAKAHRSAVRALTLLLATRYSYSDVQLTETLSTHSSYTNDASTTTVVNLIARKSAPIIASHSGVVVMPEVYEAARQKGLAYEETSRNIRKARDEAKRIVRAGLANVTGGDPRGVMRDWFGNLSVDRKNLLKDNLTKLLTSLNSKSIQFKAALRTQTWGTAMPQRFEALMQQTYIQIGLGHYYFTDSGDHSNQTFHDQATYDRVLGRHMELQDQEKELREKFFSDIKEKSEVQVATLQQEFNRASQELTTRIRQNASQLPPRGNDIISYAGVVVHEATHNVLHTDDVEVSGHTMYGPNSCFWLARRGPGLALKNADSYRLYCECFL